jgi:DMSO reductase iron-sulfur subunit
VTAFPAIDTPHAAPPELLPLDAGEQYRFGFAMDACIGCHSCEVACAEQNDTPIDVAWRRVGELEGGSFPTTRRFNLSMACNHCLEPTCLSGCPTNAYVKLDNGVVRHDAEECIGCQYCIWNCPYEVPVFDQRQKIVSKCDMCLPRLEAGQAPACVGACPTHAITVEKVNVAAWREDHAAADAPGLPPAGITLSTTRVQLPADLPADTAAVSDYRVDPEHPHWPLVFLTLLTQLSLGTVMATVATQLAGSAGDGTLAGGALGGSLAGAIALAASLFHLGRPTHAVKALRNMRTSWLSREVALFSAFAVAAFAYAAAWRSTVQGGVPALGAALGVVAVVLGVAGVYASGRLYLVPARPVWNSRRTLVAFFATALSLGPLFTLFCLERSLLDPDWIRALLGASAVGVLCQLGVYAHLVATVRRRTDRQHQGTATLLLDRFAGLFTARLACAGAGLALLGSALAVPLAGPAAAGRIGTGLVVLASGELIGRYLFYVTVVPFGMAGSFFRR